MGIEINPKASIPAHPRILMVHYLHSETSFFDEEFLQMDGVSSLILCRTKPRTKRHSPSHFSSKLTTVQTYFQLLPSSLKPWLEAQLPPQEIVFIGAHFPRFVIQVLSRQFPHAFQWQLSSQALISQGIVFQSEDRISAAHAWQWMQEWRARIRG